MGTIQTEKQLWLRKILKKSMITENCSWCPQNKLVIAVITWLSPNGKISNEIDNISMTKKWRHSLFDVRAMAES